MSTFVFLVEMHKIAKVKDKDCRLQFSITHSSSTFKHKLIDQLIKFWYMEHHRVKYEDDGETGKQLN